MQKFTTLILKAFATLLLVTGFALPAFSADINGAWSVTFNTSQGGGSMEMVIEQAGVELKGSVSGEVGNAPISGKIEEDAVSFSHMLPDYGVSADYKGKLEGNTIKGTVSFADGAATGSFTAERK